jgi:hypothetical protein
LLVRLYLVTLIPNFSPENTAEQPSLLTQTFSRPQPSKASEKTGIGMLT